MIGIDDIIATGLKIIDKVIPNPEARAEAHRKLLELQQTGELKLEEFDIKREELSINDKISARTMQGAALGQDDLFSKRFIYYFSIFWSIASATYIGFITFGTIPVENTRFADTILGFLLGTAIAGMFSFFYGSSSSSKNKDAIIQSMTNK